MPNGAFHVAVTRLAQIGFSADLTDDERARRDVAGEDKSDERKMQSALHYLDKDSFMCRRS